jgi:hypothetical protein
MHGKALHSRKDLFVDDENEPDDIRHGDCYDEKPYFPFWPLARLLITQRFTGGILRMTSGRLIATD